MHCYYEMEELVPIVGKLAAQYTANESTSVTYEKAEQLMGAVLYCMNEADGSGDGLEISAGRISAWRAYEMGAACVKRKVQEALDMYRALLPVFHDYGNVCLRHSFVEEISYFFKWYDVKFAPQDRIVTLDYPVLKDLSPYAGIDRIYEYIACIAREQEFLNAFPREFIVDTLCGYDNRYEDMVGNIYGIVAEALAQ